eukprot:COSAG02_NODE_45_length_45811_cov_83.565891_29_plen_58_part_00
MELLSAHIVLAGFTFALWIRGANNHPTARYPDFAIMCRHVRGLRSNRMRRKAVIPAS